MTFEEQTLKLENGCIVWTGFIDNGGYGRPTIKGKRILAHRYAWIKENGVIPKGLFVLHKCDNRKCVNIEHLFLGTLADNNHDRNIKHRQAKGESNGRSKLNSSQVVEIKKLIGTIGQHKIAKLYNVSRGAILEIARGKNWRHI